MQGEPVQARRGLYPRVVEWSQGWARHTVDLATGEHSVRRAPQTGLQITGYSRIAPPHRRINLGLVDTIITPDGPRQFVDPDAEVLSSGEIVRRGTRRSDVDRRRPPRRRGVL